MNAETIRVAHYVAVKELQRLHNDGQRIPRWLAEHERRLRQDMAALGHRAVPGPLEQQGWRTCSDIAEEEQCSTRTVRRRAARLGAMKIGNHWWFPP
ncbi:hypothetical protein [Nocardia sp. NPDC050413]|uniref:hypothetical protein n=1 Tax=Nocardia sp. NPDC050413 TaxID=3155784 RepID=UPI0033E1289B